MGKIVDNLAFQGREDLGSWVSFAARAIILSLDIDDHFYWTYQKSNIGSTKRPVWMREETLLDNFIGCIC
jgi:hypothetical protein